MTEESLMGVLSFAKKPNGTVKLLGQLGSKESWGYGGVMTEAVPSGEGQVTSEGMNND